MKILLIPILFLTGCAGTFINVGPQRASTEEWKYPEFKYRTLTKQKSQTEWRVYNYVKNMNEVGLFNYWQRDLFTNCEVAYQKRPVL